MNFAVLQQAVNADKFLNEQQKGLVLDRVRQALSGSKDQSGLIGGGIGLAVSRYLALSKPAQAMLILAGYGIGRVLWEHYYGKETNTKFMQFNNKIKAYEIQQR